VGANIFHTSEVRTDDMVVLMVNVKGKVKFSSLLIDHHTNKTWFFIQLHLLCFLCQVQTVFLLALQPDLNVGIFYCRLFLYSCSFYVYQACDPRIWRAQEHAVSRLHDQITKISI